MKRRDTNCQTAGCLRIKDKTETPFLHIGRDLQGVSEIGVILFVAASDIAFGDLVFDVRQSGEGAAVYFDGNMACFRHMIEMPDQPKARNVRCGVNGQVRSNAEGSHGFGGSGIKGFHAEARGVQNILFAFIELGGGCDDSGSERLGKNNDIADLCARVGGDVIGIDQARHG